MTVSSELPRLPLSTPQLHRHVTRGHRKSQCTAQCSLRRQLLFRFSKGKLAEAILQCCSIFVVFHSASVQTPPFGTQFKALHLTGVCIQVGLNRCITTGPLK